MVYDFTTTHKRFHTGSGKWDKMEKFGVKETDDIIPFSVADMEFVTAPEIVEAIKRELDTSIMGYANPTESYLESVCEWFKSRHNWEAKPEWILSTQGVVNAFFEAVRVFTEPGDGVIIMTPVYPPMSMVAEANGRRTIDCPMLCEGNRYGIDFEALEREASDPSAKMLLLCSPHNPCGRVWTREELEHIAEICLRHEVLVVSDEIHCDLTMPGNVHTVFAGLSDEVAEKCVVLTAPSKTFNIAGLQTSNAFIPNAELRERYLSALKLLNPNPKCNILGYRAAEAAYRQCGEWLDECLKVIDANRRMIVEFMGREFPQVRVTELEGTYLLWLDLNGFGLDYRRLERINQEEAKLFFDEGYAFGEGGKGFERWNLACPARYIAEALTRFKGAYSRYVK